ncbi:hypothetical protein BS50DRAFT_573491 [Corynespora cassiicola Philippines]|uniref:Uncharacterized protein n=1 Tax=Corynespora cassiicola Philippines TaxID=1448308 RepID=A0A2T2NMR2_CORCC|nr:hypothetical protein BS50DRAFT_573491 [Corynespora cassiicola Philippines]
MSSQGNANSNPGSPNQSGQGNSNIYISGSEALQQQLGQYQLYLSSTQGASGQSSGSGQGTQSNQGGRGN